jgi:hypothetical protein
MCPNAILTRDVRTMLKNLGGNGGDKRDLGEELRKAHTEVRRLR